MPRMRTIDEAYSYIKTKDPDSALRKYALRCIVIEGTIPSVKVGNKYLVNLDTLEAFLAGEVGPSELQQPSETIRRVDVRGRAKCQ